jgi:hypothetical protein
MVKTEGRGIVIMSSRIAMPASMTSNNPVKSSSASEMLAVSLAKMAWRCKAAEVRHAVGVTNDDIAAFVTA